MTGGARSGTTNGTGADWQADMALPWMSDAACAEVDPDLFFPEPGGSNRPATRICDGCPVAAQCFAYAQTITDLHGIWGGESPTGRRKLAPFAHDFVVLAEMEARTGRIRDRQVAELPTEEELQPPVPVVEQPRKKRLARRMTDLEKATIRELNALGMNDREISVQLGLPDSSVGRVRKGMGLLPVKSRKSAGMRGEEAS